MKKNKVKKKRVLPIREVIRDIKNYALWIRTIKEERSKPNSKYNQFDFNHNYFFVIYFPVTLPQEEAALPDTVKRIRLLEMLNPVHQYLDYELGFSDYLIPELNQFFDEDNEPTLTYGIVYRFAFKKLSIRYALTRIIGLGLLTWATVKWSLIPLLWSLF